MKTLLILGALLSTAVANAEPASTLGDLKLKDLPPNTSLTLATNLQVAEGKNWVGFKDGRVIHYAAEIKKLSDGPACAIALTQSNPLPRIIRAGKFWVKSVRNRAGESLVMELQDSGDVTAIACDYVLRRGALISSQINATLTVADLQKAFGAFLSALELP